MVKTAVARDGREACANNIHTLIIHKRQVYTVSRTMKGQSEHLKVIYNVKVM